LSAVYYSILDEIWIKSGRNISRQICTEQLIEKKCVRKTTFHSFTFEPSLQAYYNKHQKEYNCTKAIIKCSVSTEGDIQGPSHADTSAAEDKMQPALMLCTPTTFIFIYINPAPFIRKIPKFFQLPKKLKNVPYASTVSIIRNS
jgi:hypothetical protein